MSRHIAGHDLEYLATGSWILGTGGGGSPYSSYLSMKNYYDSGGRVELLEPEDLADDDLVAVLSTMGAPLVFQERMTDSDGEGTAACRPARIRVRHPVQKRVRRGKGGACGMSCIAGARRSAANRRPHAGRP